MTRRTDFIKTLQHQQPDNLLLDLGGNPLSSMEGQSMHKLLEFLGFEAAEADNAALSFGRVRRLDERLLKYFDIDTRSVGTILTPAKSLYKKISENEYIDEWGIRRVFTGMYWDIVDYPLKNATSADLKRYPWPDPQSLDPEEIAGYAAAAQRLYQETDYLICAEHPVYGIFELGCWMCGFDDFLLKMAMDPDFIHAFFQIVLQYQKEIIAIYYGALGRFIHYTSSGDDFATQTSLFVSPPMFQELIKPYLKERIDYTRKYTGAAFLHHSCGSVFPIVPDLIDCGVDILNPIQPLAKNMEPQKLKENYGQQIVFHGGIDTQSILPFGTRETIEKTVKETIDILNRDGGYIFAAAHNIQEDVPPQNLVYMFEAARKYGKKASA